MPRPTTPTFVGVALVTLLAIAALSTGAIASPLAADSGPSATFAVAANADCQQISLTHEGGESVRVSALEITVLVDGVELSHQPSVPFFAAEGFLSGPTGPLNEQSPDVWRAGETATFRLAETNAPAMTEASTVTVVVRHGDAVVHEQTVGAG